MLASARPETSRRSAVYLTSVLRSEKGSVTTRPSSSGRETRAGCSSGARAASCTRIPAWSGGSATAG